MRSDDALPFAWCCVTGALLLVCEFLQAPGWIVLIVGMGWATATLLLAARHR